jgi:hypothetical protein
MAYNKFTIADLTQKLHLQPIQVAWLPDVLPAFRADSLLDKLLKNHGKPA